MKIFKVFLFLIFLLKASSVMASNEHAPRYVPSRSPVIFVPRSMAWQHDVIRSCLSDNISRDDTILLLRQIEAIRLAILFHKQRFQTVDSGAQENQGGKDDISWCFVFNLPNRLGMYPIHEVVCCLDEYDLDEVLDVTEDIYVKSFEGLTAFHYAARNGFLSIFTGREENPVNFNVRDAWGQTPLWYAIEYGQQEVVDFLCENGGIF